MNASSPRSYLFVSGSKPALFAKAHAAGADVVILDLEDAVGDAAKDEARHNVTAWLQSGPPVAVRVNGPGTPWLADDLVMCRNVNVKAVLLPKAETVADIRDVRTQLLEATPLLPMVESARSLRDCEPLAAVPGVQRLVFGSLDFQADLGIPDDEGLTMFRSEMVLASRLAGILPPVDGITRQFDTPEAAERDAARARRLGFGAKLCIHPRQVAVVNAAFSPTQDEVDWARRVVSADAAAAGAATSVSDGMIDKPVVMRARAILAAAGHRSL